MIKFLGFRDLPGEEDGSGRKWEGGLKTRGKKGRMRALGYNKEGWVRNKYNCYIAGVFPTTARLFIG